MKNLVIVESPNKVNKISSILGNDYKVMATVGHIRDLMLNHEYRMGIDLETMEPSYKIDKEKQEIVDDIKFNADSASNVFIATDPDREGEAIAWHIKEAAEIDEKKVKRVTFNEITKDAVLDAISKPTTINMNLVKSQEARRMIDRIVGFRLSKLLKEKTGAKSAGRVQSVALKIIIDREKERAAFKKDEWYTVEVPYSKDSSLKYVDEKLREFKFNSEKEANELIKKLSDKFLLKNIKVKEVSVSRPKPLEMSSYLISMYTNLKSSNARSSMLIQRLYELGFVTYPRTDSTRISSVSFLKDIKNYIVSEYGKEFYTDQLAGKEKSKGKVEDAHEAIRPTNINGLTPAQQAMLKPAELKAYNLIRNHTLKCFMVNGNNEVSTLHFLNNDHNFTIPVSKKKELGFRIIDEKPLTPSEKKNLKLLDLKVGDKLDMKVKEILATHHETKPKPKYNQATLIKKMKEDGIGRPSTYTPTTRILLARVYILSEAGVFNSTEKGNIVNEFLQKYFSDIINEPYTAEMIKEVDKIAEDKLDSVTLLKKFWKEFKPRLDDAFENAEVKKIEPKKTGEKCPLDGGDLVVRIGRNGEFVACGNFPKCRYIKGNEVEYVGRECPKDGGKLVYKRSKFKTKFIGCENYPSCDYMEKIEADSKKNNNKEKK